MAKGYVEYTSKDIGDFHSFEGSPRVVGSYEGVLTNFLDQINKNYGGEDGNKNILDVGAGIGIYSEYLLQKGNNVTSLDPSPASLQQTQARKIFSTLDHSGLPEGSQAGIHVKDVLQHIPDKSSFMSLCAELLEVGGVIVCVFKEVSGLGAFRDRVDTKNQPNYYTTTTDIIVSAAERVNINAIATYKWTPLVGEADWYNPSVPRSVYLGVKS